MVRGGVVARRAGVEAPVGPWHAPVLTLARWRTLCTLDTSSRLALGHPKPPPHDRASRGCAPPKGRYSSRGRWPVLAPKSPWRLRTAHGPARSAPRRSDLCPRLAGHGPRDEWPALAAASPPQLRTAHGPARSALVCPGSRSRLAGHQPRERRLAL